MNANYSRNQCLLLSVCAEDKVLNFTSEVSICPLYLIAWHYVSRYSVTRFFASGFFPESSPRGPLW
jgi:hypothetical protein